MRTHLDYGSSCCGIDAWLMYFLGASGDACLVHKGTLIDGICLDDWYLAKSTPLVLLD
jgi:hypothetical protein